uniref:BRCT domain-containing protein n=1 Tax=Kwoniella bestiolae CBS 10118 TaxID=1296100 RepID=A0A1B9G961_9TREE|nr:hypothetical protein I302_02388 [Kwoniella bestiolae CBS 10118]OCF27546.1 hypothetical protein I302_02388 [Kwoniella bestiolae CBS 10118]
MTPPRLRRQSSSTQQSIRTVSGVPHTRSMARRAASTTIKTKSSFTVYDENATHPTSTTAPVLGKPKVVTTTAKALRSRGPLRESRSIHNLNMNALEERRDVDGGKGKRKVLEDDTHGNEMVKKMLKVEQSARSSGGGIGLVKKVKSIGHQSSTESLRSLQPSTPSTTHSFSFTVPTPAREILRKADDTFTPTDSLPSHIIARPPTPPRMKERQSTSTDIPMTPRAIPTSPNKVDGRLSRMPASLRKTPGPGLLLDANPVPSTPSHYPTTASTTSSVVPSPRKVFSVPPPRDFSGSTTPVVPPPSTLSRMPKTLQTPSMRVVPPSPLSSRLSGVVSAKKNSQSTLDMFVKKKDPANNGEAGISPFQQAPTASLRAEQATPISVVASESKISEDALIHGGTGRIRFPPPASDDDQRKPKGQDNPQAQHSSTSDPTPLIEDMPSTGALSSIKTTSSSLPMGNSTSTRTLGHMGPPSRIPMPKPTTIPVKKPLTGLGSLPERRPSTRPSMVPAQAAPAGPSIEKDKEVSPLRRKPSYPSSLGLGSAPLSRPTQRIVSNPIITPLASSNPSDDIDIPITLTQPHTNRSVSAPLRSETSLTSSTREGLTGETSKSLAGLSDALSKLKMKRIESNAPRHSIAATPSIYVEDTSRTTVLGERPSNLSSSVSSNSTSRIISSGHRPRSAVHPGDLSISSDEGAGDGVGDQSIAAMLCSTNGSKCLTGVRAFVDVRTDDGEDSSRVFVDILKGLGARVFVKPTETCTHIIYKSGKPSTLSWYRKQKQELQELQDLEEREPGYDAQEQAANLHIVGIKWVMGCKKFGKRLEEREFEVDISEEDVFQKRRKSMEPKSLAAAQGAGLGLGQPSTVRKACEYQEVS